MGVGRKREGRGRSAHSGDGEVGCDTQVEVAGKRRTAEGVRADVLEARPERDGLDTDVLSIDTECPHIATSVDTIALKKGPLQSKGVRVPVWSAPDERGG